MNSFIVSYWHFCLHRSQRHYASRLSNPRLSTGYLIKKIYNEANFFKIGTNVYLAEKDKVILGVKCQKYDRLFIHRQYSTDGFTRLLRALILHSLKSILVFSFHTHVQNTNKVMFADVMPSLAVRHKINCLELNQQLCSNIQDKLIFHFTYRRCSFSHPHAKMAWDNLSDSPSYTSEMAALHYLLLKLNQEQHRQ